MRNVLKSVVVLFAITLLAAPAANAQKMGYVDLQELMQLMPDYKKANADMELYGKSLEEELKRLSEEFQRKVADYQKNEKTMTELRKEVIQKELQDMQSRIQEFQQDAQEKVRKKESDLLKPIIEKAKAAIAQVAKEKGYSYIFDSSMAGFLYKPDADNVLGEVKKKMGIMP